MKTERLKGKVVECYNTKTDETLYMIFIQKGKGLPYKTGLAIGNKPYIATTKQEANKECRRFNQERTNQRTNQQ